MTKEEKQKAIDALKISTPIMAMTQEEFNDYIQTLNKVIDWLEQTRWIPVSERLPNFNDIVLASTNSDYDELRIVMTVYNAERFWFDGKITAWMPLPEPYKEKEEENE